MNAELAERLSAQLVDRFFAETGLSTNHRSDALAQTRFDVGLTQDGDVCELRVALPQGAGTPVYDWLGMEHDAEEIADNAANVAAEDVRWDQEHIGPTGWEPEFGES